MRGLLLINLGSPDAPTPTAVRRYLREFLSDERVLDIHPVGRAALLHLAILPFRPAQSAEAYQKIWTERGSPLRFHSDDLANEVAARLSARWHVELGMRYGTPSIRDALDHLRAAGADDIVVMPLYPQYAASSTGTALQQVFAHCAAEWNVAFLRCMPPFYDHPLFIAAWERVARPILDRDEPEFCLFSFHGLPERHMTKSDDSGGRHCLRSDDCCTAIGVANRNCYRAQCYATARALAAALELADDRWSVSFQSRLGRTPWIRPYTDVVLPELAQRGITKLAVLCPAFVADCLETLEEIGIRGRQQFIDAGGAQLTLVPSLNATSGWADAVAAFARSLANGATT